MEGPGISSFADQCGLPQRPGKYWSGSGPVSRLMSCKKTLTASLILYSFKGVYTNVFQYKSWIIDRINEIHPEANYTLATCGKSQKLSWWQKVKNWFKSVGNWFKNLF